MIEVIAIMLLSQQPVLPVLEGYASYYTVASSSRITASGEILRDDAFTCAMNEGVFGDYYRVVAKNGRAVVCRLNDRGPYIRNRVVDLSKAAMKTLGLVNQGVGWVQVYHLGPNNPNAPPERIARN